MPDVAVVGRVHWWSPPPTSVDEELVISGDGTALLVVRTARDGAPVIGTFAGSVDSGQLAVLNGQRREVDLSHPEIDPVVATAEVIAAAARDRPVATATFYAAVVPGVGVALQAVGGGRGSASFELDPDSVIIHLERDGTEIAWHEAAHLQTGFVSPTPEGLGGVGRPAEIQPGAYGTIALETAGVDGLGQLDGDAGAGPPAVAVEVSGWLRDAVSVTSTDRFRVRTAAVSLTP